MSIERDLINQMLGKENLVYDDLGNLVSEEEMFGKKRRYSDELDAEYTQAEQIEYDRMLKLRKLQDTERLLGQPDYTGASAEQYTEQFTDRPSDAGSIEEAQSEGGMLSSVIGQFLPPVDIANAIIAASENKWTHAIVTAAGFGAGLKYGRQGLAMLRDKLADIADLAQKGSKAAERQLDKIRKALDTYPEATGADNITNPSIGWEKKMEPLLNVLEKDLDAIQNVPKNLDKIAKRTDAIDSEAFSMVKGLSKDSQVKNVSSQFKNMSKEFERSTDKMKDALDRRTPFNLVYDKSKLAKPVGKDKTAIAKELDDWLNTRSEGVKKYNQDAEELGGWLNAYLSKDAKKSIGFSLDTYPMRGKEEFMFNKRSQMRNISSPENWAERARNAGWKEQIIESLNPSKNKKILKKPLEAKEGKKLTMLDKAIGGMTLTDVINRSVTGYEEE